VLPIVASARAIGPIIARVAYVIGELGAERDASVGRYVRVRAIVLNGALNAGLTYVCGSSHFRVPLGHPASWQKTRWIMIALHWSHFIVCARSLLCLSPLAV